MGSLGTRGKLRSFRSQFSLNSAGTFRKSLPENIPDLSQIVTAKYVYTNKDVNWDALGAINVWFRTEKLSTTRHIYTPFRWHVTSARSFPSVYHVTVNLPVKNTLNQRDTSYEICTCPFTSEPSKQKLNLAAQSESIVTKSLSKYKVFFFQLFRGSLIRAFSFETRHTEFYPFKRAIVLQHCLKKIELNYRKIKWL